jgi:hypothetical protein
MVCSVEQSGDAFCRDGCRHPLGLPRQRRDSSAVALDFEGGKRWANRQFRDERGDCIEIPHPTRASQTHTVRIQAHIQLDTTVVELV